MNQFDIELRVHAFTVPDDVVVIFTNVPTLVDGDGEVVGFDPDVAENLTHLMALTKAYKGCKFVCIDYQTEDAYGLVKVHGCRETA